MVPDVLIQENATKPVLHVKPAYNVVPAIVLLELSAAPEQVKIPLLVLSNAYVVPSLDFNEASEH